MATDYTTNYHLDKYTATDKPNLRDQYNAAMDKIDLALLSANTNATEAKATTQSFAGAIAGKAEQTDLNALGALLPAAQFSSQNTIKAALDAKASNTALQNEANARASADTAINNSIAQIFVPKYMVCIGDSFTYSQGGYSETPYWHAYVAKALGVTVKNFASGSTGFIAGSNKNFQAQIAEASADTTFNNNDVAYVIIYGGVNDHATLTANSVFDTIVAAENAFPNAKIFTFFNYNSYNDDQFTIRRSIINNLVNAHGRRVNTLWLCQKCEDFPTSDKLHPTAIGGRLIADEMLTYINGGKFNVLQNAINLSVTTASPNAVEVRGNPHVTGNGIEMGVQATISGASPSNPVSGSIDILLEKILSMDVQGVAGDKGFIPTAPTYYTSKSFDAAAYKLTGLSDGTHITLSYCNLVAEYVRLPLVLNGQ